VAAEPSESPTAPGTIYLLHFSGPTSVGHQHYLGWTQNVHRRFREHRDGRGSESTRVARSEGLALKLAGTWRGTPGIESQVKEWLRSAGSSYAAFCPYCGGDLGSIPAFLRAVLGAPTTLVRIDLSLVRPASG
jgi:predicted GIY-YIG superfamily endonuclease